jgi:L-amino acid N-acyltransferase YncA
MAAVIRLATPDDAGNVLAVYAPYCSTPISFEAGPPGEDEMRQRIVQTLRTGPWLVCEEAGRVIGYAYAGPHRERAAYRWSVDTTVYVRPGQYRSGVGRALYTSLFGVLALQGFVSAYAGVTLPNPASVGLHEAMGFVLVGTYQRVGFKNGSWHDVAWYQRLLRTPSTDPAPPKSLSEVLEGGGWQAAVEAGASLLKG